MLLWLWCRLVATAAAPIRPLALELPHAAGGTLKRKNKQTNQKDGKHSDGPLTQRPQCFNLGLASRQERGAGEASCGVRLGLAWGLEGRLCGQWKGTKKHQSVLLSPSSRPCGCQPYLLYLRPCYYLRKIDFKLIH